MARLRFRSPSLQWLLLCVASTVAPVAAQEPRSDTSGLTRLVDAFEGARGVQGRLTGGFSHAPYEPGIVSTPNQATTDAALYRVAAAAAEIFAAASRTPSPDTLHAAGVLFILWGKPDEAVSRLEAARARAPDDSAILSDLSLAYFARGRRDAEPHNFIDALVVADEAVSANNALVEAHYNKALILQTLHLVSGAGAAWRHYLSLDGESAWADEARDYLRNLAVPSRREEWSEQKEVLSAVSADVDAETTRAIVARFPQETRVFAEQDLLHEWAFARRQNQLAKADRALGAAREIGHALAAENGDWMVSDSIDVIDEAIALGELERIAGLVDAHTEFGRGKALYADFEIQEARDRFERAELALSAAGSPFRAWSTLNLAMCRAQQGEYRAALDRLAPLLSFDEDRYPNLLARVHWIQGFAHLSRADPTASLDSYRASLRLFQTTGELQNVSFVSMLIAQNLGFLGDTKTAWRYYDLALQGVQEAGDDVAAYAVYTVAAETVSRQPFPRIPLYFQNEAIRLAATMEAPVIRSEALYRRSTILHRLGDGENARRDLAEARRYATQITDVGEQRAITARVAISEAEQLSDTDPARSVRALTKTLELYRDTDFAYLLLDIYLQRGRAWTKLGEVARAESDLKSAIEETERQRERVLDPAFRISYFDTVQDLFRQMVLFQIESMERPDLALDYMERGRARLLLDAIGAGTFSLHEGLRRRLGERSQPLDNKALKNRLPDDVGIVEYMVADEELLIWIIRRDSLDFVSTPISHDELRVLTERFVDLVARGERGPELAEVSSELYDVLLGDIMPLLRADDTVIFVPDRFLNTLPFGALASSTTGRYLIQDHAVGIAPSATHHLQATQRDEELARTTKPSVLIIANPTFDRSAFPRLTELPSAQAAAATIAELYTESSVLTSGKATKTRFLDLAGEHSVVHFGGHAVINLEYPALSRLVFSPASDSDSGVLYAYELYEQRFLETRLVFLASCRSSRRLAASTETLASAFLSAGVPAVLGSLWDVEDRATSEFSILFHHRLMETGDAREALRAAQLALIEGPDETLRNPASWAPFVLIGGGVSSSSKKVEFSERSPSL